MTERDTLEKKLIDVGKFDRAELAYFTLEELQNFWVIHLFETRKHREFSESGEEEGEGNAPKADDYA